MGLFSNLLVSVAGMLYRTERLRSMTGSALSINNCAVLERVTVFMPVCPVAGPMRMTFSGMLLGPLLNAGKLARI